MTRVGAIASEVVETPVGPCVVTMRGGGICRIEFRQEESAGRPRRAGSSAVHRWLRGWFAGRAVRPPLDFSEATPFERRVYDVVRRIPRGRTLTYGEVARKAGRPGAARAVGQAMRRNPICLFVP